MSLVKFKFYSTKSAYQTDKDAGNVNEGDIVAISDTQEIIAHQVSINASEIGANITNIESQLENKADLVDGTVPDDQITKSFEILPFNGMVNGYYDLQDNGGENVHFVYYMDDVYKFVGTQYEDSSPYYFNWDGTDEIYSSAIYGEGDANGVTPSKNKLYIDITSNKIYMYCGEWDYHTEEWTYTFKEVIDGSSLPVATSESLGGIMLGYTTDNNNYALQADDSGNGYINIASFDYDYLTNKPVLIDALGTYTDTSKSYFNILGSVSTNTYAPLSINKGYDSTTIQYNALSFSTTGGDTTTSSKTVTLDTTTSNTAGLESVEHSIITEALREAVLVGSVSGNAQTDDDIITTIHTFARDNLLLFSAIQTSDDLTAEIADEEAENLSKVIYLSDTDVFLGYDIANDQYCTSWKNTTLNGIDYSLSTYYGDYGSSGIQPMSGNLYVNITDNKVYAYINSTLTEISPSDIDLTNYVTNNSVNTATSDFSLTIPVTYNSTPLVLQSTVKGSTDSQYDTFQVRKAGKDTESTRYNMIQLEAVQYDGTTTAKLTSRGALTVKSLSVSGGTSTQIMTGAGGSVSASEALSLLGLSNVDSTALGEHVYLGSTTVTSDNVVETLQNLLTTLASAGILSTNS